jgi:transposase-like protein
MERLETKGTGAPSAAEGARSATGEALGAAAVEVVAKAQRRQFSAAYKTRILREAEACAGTGQIGALLRREGLYSSHLTQWRKLRAQGALGALAAKKRGPKPVRDAREREIAKLSRENARLRRKLAQAEAVIEVQKKLSEILGISLNPPARDESEE